MQTLSSTGSLFNTPIAIEVKNTVRSEKQGILRDIIGIYNGESQKKMRAIKLKRTFTPREISVFLSKHSKGVLYEILSVARDKERRREDAGGYIAGNFIIFR